jgi:hypothetical protein
MAKTRIKGKKTTKRAVKSRGKSASRRSGGGRPASNKKSARGRSKPAKAAPRSGARARAKTVKRAPSVKRTPPRKQKRSAPKAAGAQKTIQKASPPKAAVKSGATRAKVPGRSKHAVETDEPRERLGDANDRAFVGTDTREDEAQELGEEFVRSVTSGEEAESEMEEEEAVEEEGGPFVVTSAKIEFGYGTDESNPADAERAPFPSVSPPVSPETDGEDEEQ